MKYKIYLGKSIKPNKKYTALIFDKNNNFIKDVSFGAEGYSDYILSKGNDKKKNAYLARHGVNEDWTIDGILKPAFFARWILWHKKTLKESIKDAEERFNIKINFVS
jgi:hypothetical protein